MFVPSRFSMPYQTRQPIANVPNQSAELQIQMKKADHYLEEALSPGIHHGYEGYFGLAFARPVQNSSRLIILLAFYYVSRLYDIFCKQST